MPFPVAFGTAHFLKVAIFKERDVLKVFAALSGAVSVSGAEHPNLSQTVGSSFCPRSTLPALLPVAGAPNRGFPDRTRGPST